MKRRSFFKSLALIASAASLSPTIFIPKFEPVVWKRSVWPVSHTAFTQFLIDQIPMYDKLILRDMVPTDQWGESVSAPLPPSVLWTPELEQQYPRIQFHLNRPPEIIA